MLAFVIREQNHARDEHYQLVSAINMDTLFKGILGTFLLGTYLGSYLPL